MVNALLDIGAKPTDASLTTTIHQGNNEIFQILANHAPTRRFTTMMNAGENLLRITYHVSYIMYHISLLAQINRKDCRMKRLFERL